mmetsp:Transcript_1661/g.3640  ORF Transcript_1661/g.3640 Transcript_1661/m.3640 type:complete len:321 (+) Transcript_1661:870-1832(+)
MRERPSCSRRHAARHMLGATTQELGELELLEGWEHIVFGVFQSRGHPGAVQVLVRDFRLPMKRGGLRVPTANECLVFLHQMAWVTCRFGVVGLTDVTLTGNVARPLCVGCVFVHQRLLCTSPIIEAHGSIRESCFHRDLSVQGRPKVRWATVVDGISQAFVVVIEHVHTLQVWRISTPSVVGARPFYFDGGCLSSWALRFHGVAVRRSIVLIQESSARRGEGSIHSGRSLTRAIPQGGSAHHGCSSCARCCCAYCALAHRAALRTGPCRQVVGVWLWLLRSSGGRSAVKGHGASQGHLLVLHREVQRASPPGHRYRRLAL